MPWHVSTFQVSCVCGGQRENSGLEKIRSAPPPWPESSSLVANQIQDVGGVSDPLPVVVATRGGFLQLVRPGPWSGHRSRLPTGREDYAPFRHFGSMFNPFFINNLALFCRLFKPKRRLFGLFRPGRNACGLATEEPHVLRGLLLRRIASPPRWRRHRARLLEWISA